MILAKSNPVLEKKLNFAIFPYSQGGPLMHVIAAKAVAFKEALQPDFKTYQEQVMKNAKAMVEVFLDRGFEIVSGKTENHLFLLNLIAKNITGQEASLALAQANITVNKNSVPNDPKPPMITSGLRLGTPAITTRGFKEKEASEISNWICDILDNIGDVNKIATIKQNALALCKKFPVYKNE
jgi:glycine hydroxymethyltransferase